MAEQALPGQSQRAAAMAAFSQTVEKTSDPEAAKGPMTAREKAMASLNQKGVVNSREMRGEKGESQHSQAMKNLQIKDQPGSKVIPNWKQTAAQKTAASVRKEIGGGAASARSMFQQVEANEGAPKATVPKPTKSFVPVASTGGGGSTKSFVP
eukprot:3568401-Prymnesium_polylepis.1